ncbi:MAG: MATE family efflux transporter [Pseudomonadota bacterium]
MTAAKFTSGSTMRHVAVMTATSSFGLLALFFVDAINLFYISMLGVTELAAAIGFAGTLQFFMISISIGLLIAGSANVSRAIGAGDTERARHLASSATLTAFLAMSVIAALVWIWREEALYLIGARGEALVEASHFLAIALPSVPLIGIGMSCSGTLRAIGEANRAMYVTLGGGAVAAVLDPILIFVFDLGLTGAALAMVLTRIVIAGIGLWLVIVKHDMLARPSLPVWLADLPPILKIAGPAIATQLSTPFGNAYLTNTVAAYGDEAVAGWAVIGRVSALAFGGLYALAGAVGPIVGQNFGAGLFDRIRSTYRDALIFVVGYVLVSWIALIILAPHIATGFGLTGVGSTVLTTFAYYAAGAFAFTGALFVANSAFNNLGRPLWSTMFNWSRDALVIPLLVFAFAGSLGAVGAVWIQAVAGIIVGTCATIVGWRTVGETAVDPGTAEGAATITTPAFSSGRAATGLASEAASPEPLVRSGENR